MIEPVTAIERVRATYFQMLVLSTIAVGAGVILEEVDKLFEWMLSKPRIIYRLPTFLLIDPERHKRRLRFIARLFWIVLLVGVAGEGIFEFLVAGQDTLLQNATSERLEKAANRLGELTRQQAQFRLAVQQALLPREIVFVNRDGDISVRKEHRDKVNRFAGTVVFIRSVPTGEAENLAANIAELLKESRWIVKNLGPSEFLAPVTAGVHVMTREQWMTKGLNDLKIRKDFKWSGVSNAARALQELLLLDLGPPYGPPRGATWDPMFPNPITGKYFPDVPEGTVLVSVGDIPVEHLLSQIAPLKPDPNAK